MFDICCQESVKFLDKQEMVHLHYKLQNCLVFYDSMFWYPNWLQFSFDPD